MLNKGMFWLAALLAIGAAAWFRYHADAEPPAILPSKIAFVTGGSGNYWQLTMEGAREAAEKLGVELVVRMPEQSESVEEQNEILTALGNNGEINGIAVSPLDADGQTPVINTLAASIPVVTFDSDAPQSSRHGFVGTSNFSAGLMAGTLVKRAIPEGGKIAVFVANLTKTNMQDRQAGFKTRIAESPVPEESAIDPRYTIVGFYPDLGDDEQCAANIRQVLSEQADVSCMVGMNARHGRILLDVLRDEDKLGKIKLITFDANEETLGGVEDGYIFATIAQDPFRYGFDAVNMLVSLCDGNDEYLPVVGKGAIHVSVEPVTADNLKDFRGRMEARAAKAAAAGAAKKT